MSRLLIWGTGDQGTVTLDCALLMKKYDTIDFLTIKEKESRSISHYKIYQEEDVCLTQFLKCYDEVIVATGNNDLREAKIDILRSLNIPLATIIHPTAFISPFAKVCGGTTVLANAVIHTNAKVDIGCIINTGVIVEHDCIIKEFVNISPQTAMAGHTEIGKKTFIGIGTTIIDDIKIGENVTVGGGAVVIHNIPNHVVIVGIPAKIIKRKAL